MDFSQALILLVVAIVGIITITVSIRFDFTKYLSDCIFRSMLPTYSD